MKNENLSFELMVEGLKESWAGFLEILKIQDNRYYVDSEIYQHFLSRYVESLGYTEVYFTREEEGAEIGRPTQLLFSNEELGTNLVLCLDAEYQITKALQYSELYIICVRERVLEQEVISIIFPDSTETLCIPENVFPHLFLGQSTNVVAHFETESTLRLHTSSEDNILVPASDWIYILENKKDFLYELHKQVVHKYPTNF